jgi:queuine tRNA-ribosyltransferase
VSLKKHYLNQITIKNKTYKLPIYLPDATLGVIKSLGLSDTDNIEGVVVNSYHLAANPGISTLNKFGGIKEFMNYRGLVVSDSGGWQIFSLIHRHNRPGKITNEGVEFYTSKKSKKQIFTPEDSIRTQFEIGSDIIICLDDFTNPHATAKEIEQSVERTILWAKRSKVEFEKQVNERELDEKTRPYLFSVVQGHNDKKLRKTCAEALIDVGFDGYGYGGYPMDSNGNFDYDLSEYVANLLLENAVKFALGIGTPWQIATLYEQGWDIFDCTLPTRDARHKRLYILKEKPVSREQLKNKDFYEYLNIENKEFAQDTAPLSKHCECPTCKSYSRAYLHHLFEINEMAAFRLATIHNLEVYSKVIEILRGTNG